MVIINDSLWLNYCYKYRSIVDFSAAIVVGAGNVLYSVRRIIHNLFRMHKLQMRSDWLAGRHTSLAANRWSSAMRFPIRKTL